MSHIGTLPRSSAAPVDNDNYNRYLICPNENLFYYCYIVAKVISYLRTNKFFEKKVHFLTLIFRTSKHYGGQTISSEKEYLLQGAGGYNSGATGFKSGAEAGPESNI